MKFLYAPKVVTPKNILKAISPILINSGNLKRRPVGNLNGGFIKTSHPSQTFLTRSCRDLSITSVLLLVKALGAGALATPTASKNEACKESWRVRLLGWLWDVGRYSVNMQSNTYHMGFQNRVMVVKAVGKFEGQQLETHTHTNTFSPPPSALWLDLSGHHFPHNKLWRRVIRRMWKSKVGPQDYPQKIRKHTVDGKNPAPLVMPEMVFLPLYKIVFGHPKWCRIFSINRMSDTSGKHNIIIFLATPPRSHGAPQNEAKPQEFVGPKWDLIDYINEDNWSRKLRNYYISIMLIDACPTHHRLNNAKQQYLWAAQVSLPTQKR